jgi:hypothetical protein
MTREEELELINAAINEGRLQRCDYNYDEPSRQLKTLRKYNPKRHNAGVVSRNRIQAPGTRLATKNEDELK